MTRCSLVAYYPEDRNSMFHRDVDTRLPKPHVFIIQKTSIQIFSDVKTSVNSTFIFKCEMVTLRYGRHVINNYRPSTLAKAVSLAVDIM
jgi:hypothetical protein